MTAYDDLVKWCHENGITRSRAANRFGHEVWARKGVALTFSEGISAASAEVVRIQAIRDISLLSRKPKTARARETAQKKAAANVKRLRELEEQIALRNRELGGMREYLDSAEARAIIRVIEGHEREFRRLRAQMTEIPQTNAHAGSPRAQHRS